MRVAGVLTLILALGPAGNAAALTRLQDGDPTTVSGGLANHEATAAAGAEAMVSLETTPIPTRIALVAPSTCNAKQAVRVVASLTTSDGAPVSGAAVVIERVAPTQALIGSGTTDASGTFALSVAPTSRIVLRARYGGVGELLPSASPDWEIKPRVLFGTPWTHDKTAYPGQRLPARGTLWPYHAAGSAGTSILCERYERGKWVKRAVFSAKVVKTKSGSGYRGIFRLPSSGTWRIRARHSDAGHAYTLGPARTIVVKNWRKRYAGKLLRGFRPKKKMVAITIDDGPNRRTLQVCSILERYGAKGTFFFTRELLNRGYHTQARQVYDRGHEVANHTANHKMLTGSYATSYRQAYLPMATIRSATGFDPIWVRPMGGGIDRTGLRAVARTGQLCCNWSVDSYDSHARYTPPATLYRNVIRSTNSGDVILIHQTHPETIEALPRICKELKRRGYRMVTLSELAANSSAR